MRADIYTDIELIIIINLLALAIEESWCGDDDVAATMIWRRRWWFEDFAAHTFEGFEAHDFESFKFH